VDIEVAHGARVSYGRISDLVSTFLSGGHSRSMKEETMVMNYKVSDGEKITMSINKVTNTNNEHTELNRY
jgi:hypothetical protein